MTNEENSQREVQDWMLRMLSLEQKIAGYGVLPMLIGTDMSIQFPLSTGTAVALTIPGTSYDLYQKIKNQNVTGEDYAAILTHLPLKESYMFKVLGIKGMVTKFFTQRGVKVDYINRAKNKDLESVLLNPVYQNIAIIGHQNTSHWKTRDGVVDVEYVDGIMTDKPKKRGYFLQIGCGDNREIPLGRSVVQDPKKLLGYYDLQSTVSLASSHFKKDYGLNPLDIKS